MSNEPLDAVELHSGTNPQRCVIWMHGLGADGNDFVPIVQELGLDNAPPIRFIFPHAPMQPVTINNGFVMRAWYDVRWGDLEGRSKEADEKGVRASQTSIGALIDEEMRENGTPADKIVLAGFSQGGAIALQTGLRYPQKLAGIMALSCYLPLHASLEKEASAENKRTPVFMAHGVDDAVVPYAMGKTSRDVLIQAGYQVEWHDYPMQHSVCLEEVKDIGAWLRRVLA